MRQYVGVILINSKGFVLAQHRDNNPEIIGPNTWCTVGGSVDGNDLSLKQAAKRELEEETGYKVREGELELLV
ncbi:MAG: NUDIX hydrolase [Patescibacteria group bacterium]